MRGHATHILSLWPPAKGFIINCSHGAKNNSSGDRTHAAEALTNCPPFSILAAANVHPGNEPLAIYGA